jgi:NAD+ diphosphatase
MSCKLPESYPDCELLPFNRTALETDFELEPPSMDPGGPGFWLLLQGTKILICAGQEAALPRDELPAGLADLGQGLYIGRWRGRPCRLLSLSHETELPPRLEAINILDKEPGLPLALLSLGGLGNAILHWEKTSRCCDNCGGTMAQLSGEWGKRCGNCGALHFPRIHPCIIVLVRRDNQLLLVRKPEWPAGRFGLVAGFVEFGENLEQTVVRELFEETGIKVRNIRYRGSQSWPFPSQLMTGFSADYSSGELKLQADELDEGDWFDIDDLPQLPPRRSIARWLIDMELARALEPEG